MKKINVDQSKCIGCGACIAIDENSFEFNDDGLSKAKIDTVEEPSEELVNAAESCPAGAITLEDVEEEKSE